MKKFYNVVPLTRVKVKRWDYFKNEKNSTERTIFKTKKEDLIENWENQELQTFWNSIWVLEKDYKK